MVGLRRALLFSLTERYISIALNFVMIATLARLLTPEEFGYSVIGAAAMGFAECLRDFGTSGYLVQARSATHLAARTAFTVMLTLTLAVAATMWVAAGPIAQFYGRAGLESYLHITALGLLMGPFAAPPLALLRRDMQFQLVAIINVASAGTIALVTVSLAVMGASYMSFAWGIWAGASVTAALAVMLRGDMRIFRPSLAEWREILSFGGYSSAAGVFWKLQDFVPSLIIGRLIDFNAVGLFSRAVMVCQLPDKCLLNGLMPVALPALAAEARAGRDLTSAYLKATAYITAIQWPSLLLLSCLAHPAVLILLGVQWVSIVPLIQIISLGLLLCFPTVLSYPLLAAAGGIRHAMIASLVGLLSSIIIALFVSRWGLTALALGVVLNVSIQSGLSLYLIRLYAPFSLIEMACTLRKSAATAATTALVPLLAVALNGFDFDFSIAEGIMVGIGSVIVWIATIRWTGHALEAEVDLLFEMVRKVCRIIHHEIRTRNTSARGSRTGET
ncbi:O-antigen/teichoic acid export membrane protein [Ancylobacter sp. 3268]|uniref:oligosaccharide flippase family protein n=1 Tax=Ancylobacter sp. 3268 TaxID=2817752 RepID=UPI002860FE09|nr:oligosaccharide flippase family protein [Ancylobacter sp. 3268]MDR6955756.1 O-antigen/teichoic acid export membrane protein [Ancylobacter sp. 3268]